MKAKCLRIYEFGNPTEVLRIENKTIVPPQGQEILVRMLARPINPSDLIPIWGKYAHRITLPTVPGYEGVGIVEEVGPLVSPGLIGQRVLPLRGEGTWQEVVKTQTEFAVPIPSTMDDFTAAQMYINPITAFITCTEVLKLRATDVLLVNACGSAIGHIYAQLSKLLGFQLIAVTRSSKHTKELQQLGADLVIDASQMPLNETVKAITNGRGADAAIDSIGGDAGNQLAYCVKPGGKFLAIGLLSGVQVNWTNIVKEAKVQATLFHLRHWQRQTPIKKWQQIMQQLINLVQNDSLKMMKVNAGFPLLDFHKAIDAVESSKKGKLFLTSYE
ncbi:zinc-dependent alcohol dehydrogenase family protein [Lysinibacillus cavernae]|uniref:zinc-dependent alcohol dehydrogenase family protein n=1 Tax=Lysinibacillus cavernae TaxID=2666135 RepID=UPI0012D9CB64|nr:zinc-dependent alcohol dehydrogenase family protein [Lysinibacillus cavernae]